MPKTRLSYLVPTGLILMTIGCFATDKFSGTLAALTGAFILMACIVISISEK